MSLRQQPKIVLDVGGTRYPLSTTEGYILRSALRRAAAAGRRELHALERLREFLAPNELRHQEAPAELEPLPPVIETRPPTLASQAKES